MLISIRGLASDNNFSKNYGSFWIQSLKMDFSNYVEIQMNELQNQN